jgi:hypothetical protein
MGFSCLLSFLVGKRTYLRCVENDIEGDYLTKRIQASLYCRPENFSIEFPSLQSTQPSDAASLVLDATEKSIGTLPEGESKRIIVENKEEEEKDFEKNTVLQFYAQLIGFSTKKAARAFIAEMGKHGINLVIKDRHSESSKGKKIDWFQVITQNYENAETLSSTINAVKAHAQLHDIRIIQHHVTV